MAISIRCGKSKMNVYVGIKSFCHLGNLTRLSLLILIWNRCSCCFPPLVFNLYFMLSAVVLIYVFPLIRSSCHIHSYLIQLKFAITYRLIKY